MLTARDVHFGYGGEPVLSGADLVVAQGESVALVGPSGAGKSSLLYCLAGILLPSSGEITLDETVISAASASERCRLRRERFGFVFQFSELVPELSIRENVEFPLRLMGFARKETRRRATDIMERLGILASADRRPGQVSGGQAQRAAVARAVIHRPTHVFADEPTGSLDTVSGRQVLEELLALVKEEQSSLILVTHDQNVAAAMERQIQVVDGRCMAGVQ
ncbi:ABC transporter ATP-binding protein [Kineosporia sp. NBRC 101677]|uniref:ABC transporter ATP-binding protein n=1 Tax=Kineosporia sp. NBRC 101677 TaxID=3032197 RepID=UPI0024A4A219|nr:ATP-binding cassette domain-containing protein [Kineosporia sp. NBRC 101677]GLY19571.1 ABC transporter ATP-binding protein [Kineosporia sp. NBRC 101677]